MCDGAICSSAQDFEIGGPWIGRPTPVSKNEHLEGGVDAIFRGLNSVCAFVLLSVSIPRQQCCYPVFFVVLRCFA